MRKLELQEKDLQSQYTDEEKLDPYNYKSVTNTSLDYAPKKEEKWSQYIVRLCTYAEISAEKNRKTHIDGPRKAWYTHRNPMGCFMCEDTNLISMMLRVLKLITNQYPDNRF